jgi:hypothetical protein
MTCGTAALSAAQLTAALERVRAGADIMPKRQLEKVLVGELGPDWAAKLSDFEYDPLAAASIGQVRWPRRLLLPRKLPPGCRLPEHPLQQPQGSPCMQLCRSLHQHLARQGSHHCSDA